MVETQYAPYRYVALHSEKNGVIESDSELIARVICSDPAAAQRFVVRYRRYIFRILSYMGLRSEDQEDAFQQVFIHLWENDYQRLRLWKGGVTGKFTAYLRVIVTRLVGSYPYRRRNVSSVSWSEKAEELIERDFVYNAADVVPDPAQEILRRENRSAVVHAMRQLASRDSELLVRRYWLQQSYNEIAGSMEITVNHVGVALGRAEIRLKKALCTQYPDLFHNGGSQTAASSSSTSGTVIPGSVKNNLSYKHP